MTVLKDLPSHSRIWIYQSNREFTETEVKQIKALSEQFINEWTSHNQKMKASIELLHNLFIVIGVDEKTAPASGCGIDKSVKFIQSLEKEFNTTLLDRMNVAYKKNSDAPTLKGEEKGKIQICTLNELASLLKEEKINSGALVFNNLVSTKEEFEKNWEIPIEKSWHKQFIT